MFFILSLNEIECPSFRLSVQATSADKMDDNDHYLYSDVEDDDDDDEGDDREDDDDHEDDEDNEDSNDDSVDDYDEIGYGEEPWRPAVESGNVQQLQDLIQEHGIDILTRNCVIAGEDMTTALLVAVRHNHLPIVQYLLEHCRSVVHLNALEHLVSWTALHYAAENGNAKMVRYLISQGMDVNIKSNHRDCQSTALYVAARNNRSKVFQCLLETEGCNVDAAIADETEDDNANDEYGEDGNEPLLFTIIGNENLSMVQSLMEHYTKVSAERLQSESTLALHNACEMEMGGFGDYQVLGRNVSGRLGSHTR